MKDTLSPIKNQQTIGISEAFTFDIENHYEPGDYLWKYASSEDLWLGAWGFIRAFATDSTHEKKPLQLSSIHNPPPPITPPAKEHCRQFKVRAVLKTVEYRADLLDPFGLVYEITEVAEPNGQFKKIILNGIHEPMVLRCRQGEWINVEVTNNLNENIEPEPMFPQLPHDDGDRKISSKISLHADLLRYNIDNADGSNVGLNSDSNIDYIREENNTAINVKNYFWFADKELGAVPLQDMADIRNHRHHGLIGAVVVHSNNVTPYKVLPKSYSAVVSPVSEQWYGTRVTLIDYNFIGKKTDLQDGSIPKAAIIEERFYFYKMGFGTICTEVWLCQLGICPVIPHLSVRIPRIRV